MPVLGFIINEIEAKKEQNVSKNIKINSTPTILDIEEKKMNIPGLDKVLLVKFKFDTKYEPKIGYVSLKGEIVYNTKDNKKVINDWKKDKKLDKDIAVNILNVIFRKCLTKIVSIAEDLQLPPPIRFPIVKAQEQSKYIG